MTTSIVDFLKSQGKDSSYAARTKLAVQLGIQNYTGTSAQNTQLLQTLQKQATSVPAIPAMPGQPVEPSPSPNQGIQDQINQAQAQVQQLQQQLTNANAFGYGEGGANAGQQIPEAILSGEQVAYDTGNQQMNDMLDQLSKALKSITDSGKVVNPDIELTPAQITEFTNLASSQISPYYKSQILAIQSDLSKSVENLQKQYDISRQSEEAQFKSSLSGQRESMAGAGTISSGFRGQAEQSMIEAQNRSLNLGALQTENQIGGNLRTLEGQIGTANLPTMPQFQTYQASATGQGSFTPGRTLNFGTTGGITGTIPQSQQEAELLRLSNLKKAARENRSLDFYL